MLNSRRNLALACALSAVAGYVDGIGFLQLGGLFVSFMSGNSTRMGVSLAAEDWTGAIQALALIALFVIGAAAGSLIVLGRGRSRYRRALVLLAEALLLAAAALCYAFAWPNLAVAAIVLAMGMENAVFQIRGGAGLGLTYVTGALVKVGQLAATALTGDRRPALGMGSKSAAMGGAGVGLARWRARLSLDQPRLDLVCRSRYARAQRHHCRDHES